MKFFFYILDYVKNGSSVASSLALSMVAQYTLYLLQNGVHRLARLAPGSKEIDQNKLATVYYIIKCLHNYLSISVKRLKVC